MKLIEVPVVVPVDQAEAPNARARTLYEAAPDTAPQLSKAEVAVMLLAARLEGCSHTCGVQPTVEKVEDEE